MGNRGGTGPLCHRQSFVQHPMPWLLRPGHLLGGCLRIMGPLGGLGSCGNVCYVLVRGVYRLSARPRLRCIGLSSGVGCVWLVGLTGYLRTRGYRGYFKVMLSKLSTKLHENHKFFCSYSGEIEFKISYSLYY